MPGESIEGLVEEEVILAAETSSRAEAEGHSGWRMTLAAMFVAQLCAMIGFAFVMPFIPLFVRELGVSEKALPVWSGLLMTGSGMMMSVAAPFWGWVADRYGRKLMVQRAMFGGAVVLSSMAAVRDVGQLLALRTLQGGITGTVSASIALISSVVPAAYMGFSLGLMQTAVFVGNAVGPWVGGHAAEAYGYRTPFLITGGILLFAGFLVLFGAKERFRRPPPEEIADSSVWDVFRSLGSVLRSPGMIPLLAVYCMINLGGAFVVPIFPLFVENVIGSHSHVAAATGLLLLVSGVTAAVAAICAGWLSDTLGYKPVLVACTAFAGLLSFPHVVATNMTQLLLLRAAVGLGSGGMVPAMNAMIAANVSRRNLGKAYGLTTTASALGWASGPLLGGIAAATLGLRWPFAIMGGLLLLMALVAQFTLRENQAEEASPRPAVLPGGPATGEESGA